jgi:hypoxanthine phosphoribosyltransferase
MKNFEVLIKNEDIISRVKLLAKEINTRYKNEPVLLVCVLKGAVVFYAELLKHINNNNMELDFIQVKSYEGVSTTGKITLVKDLNSDIKDKHVVLVEDIVDTGITANWLYEYLLPKQPKSLLMVSLLQKPSKLRVDLKIETLIGFSIDDLFVLGYGLDLDQKYRNLQDVLVFKQN